MKSFFSPTSNSNRSSSGSFFQKSAQGGKNQLSPKSKPFFPLSSARSLDIQRQQELNDRTLERDFEIPAVYPDFRSNVAQWLAQHVMSRTEVEVNGTQSPIHREQSLISASNLRNLHQQLQTHEYIGQTLTLRANLIAGSNRYEEVRFSILGHHFLAEVNIEGNGNLPNAETTRGYLERQAGANTVHPPYNWTEGEPSFMFHLYVRSEFFHYRANIDMRHFFIVGRRGEGIGGFFEFLQGFSSNQGQQHSANDPQDYYSNMLGSRFHTRYYQPDGLLSDQLRRFFSEISQFTHELPLHQRPSAGPQTAPELSQEVQDRLTAHDSEAITPAAFIAFVERKERWISDQE